MKNELWLSDVTGHVTHLFLTDLQIVSTSVITTKCIKNSLGKEVYLRIDGRSCCREWGMFPILWDPETALFKLLQQEIRTR